MDKNYLTRKTVGQKLEFNRDIDKFWSSHLRHWQIITKQVSLATNFSNSSQSFDRISNKFTHLHKFFSLSQKNGFSKFKNSLNSLINERKMA